MKYYDCHTSRGMLEYRDKEVKHNNQNISLIKVRASNEPDRLNGSIYICNNDICLFCTNCYNGYTIHYNINMKLELNDDFMDKMDFKRRCVAAQAIKQYLNPEIDIMNIIGSSNLCPFCLSKNTLCDIDYELYPTIVLLNKKGFTTKYCCSGHEIDNNGYIYFNDNNILNYINLLPDTWEIDLESLKLNNCIIRSDYIDKYNHAEAIDDIARFAEMLPNINEEKGE